MKELNFKYEYTREIVEWNIDPEDPESEIKVGYNIDHPVKISQGIYLAKEIKSAFPENHPKTICSGDTCEIYFEKELTVEEKTTLDNLVSANKQNT